MKVSVSIAWSVYTYNSIKCALQYLLLNTGFQCSLLYSNNDADTSSIFLFLWPFFPDMVHWDQISAEKHGKVSVKPAAEEFQRVLWRGPEGVWAERPGGNSVFRNVHGAPRCTLQKTEAILLRAPHPSGKTAPIRYDSWCYRVRVGCSDIRCDPTVCFPPGVHGCFVRLHAVLLRVEERSGPWITAHSQHFHIHGSDQVGLQPGPKCAGANPQCPAGTLWHVPALLVRLAFSTLPWQAAGWASSPPWCSKGQRAGRGAEPATTDHPDGTTNQHRQAGELKGMLTRDDAARWVSDADHSHSVISHGFISNVQSSHK